ncbi:MAG: hypothetical protein HPY45_08840 [Anaerolineae bacterium]|nr:hypothetical protein [Anaerolineae bacterium]
MSPDPYVDKLLDQDLPCKDKLPVRAKVSCVLHARSAARGLELCPFPSRAVLKHEIHELILTTEDAAPGKTVNNISYLCFFELLQSGMLWVGDRVEVNGKLIGYLAGYDFSHLPNHMNMIVQVKGDLRTGYELGLKPDDEIVFVFVHGKRNWQTII